MQQSVREVLTGKGRLPVAADALRPLTLTPPARLLLRAPGRPQSQAEVQQLLTALGAVYRESHLIPARLVLAGCVSAVIAASVLLLSQLSVHFGDPSKYADAQTEFPSALIQVCLHGKSVLAAGILSVLALLCLLVSLGIVASKAGLELHSS